MPQPCLTIENVEKTAEETPELAANQAEWEKIDPSAHNTPVSEKIKVSEVNKVEAATRENLDLQGQEITKDIAEMPEPEPEPKKKKLFDALARKMYPEVAKFYNAEMDRLRNAYSVIRDTTVGEASVWARISRIAAQNFTNREAPIISYIMSYAGMKDRAGINHPIVAALNHMQAEVRGLFNTYMEHGKDFLDYVDSVAAHNSEGLSRENVRTVMGMYADIRHILNDHANERQIDKWRAQAAELREKNGRGDLNEAVKLEMQADMLEEYLDSTEPPENIVTAGMTDGQARELREQYLRTTGITEAEFEQGADYLVAMANRLLEENIRAGNVSPEMMANIAKNNFKQYVPLMAHGDNNSGFIDDVHPFFEQRFHVRSGMRELPDDAYTSLVNMARRTASTNGSKEVREYMYMLAKRNTRSRKEGGPDYGLRLADYDKLWAMRGRSSGNPYIRAYIDRVTNSGGYIYTAPTRVSNKNGIIDTKRMLIYFDPEWKGLNGLNGKMLNEAMAGVRTMTNTEKVLTGMTSGYGQMFTRFKMFFAPNNMQRDIVERTTHMASRDFYDDNGNIVQGYKLVGSLYANAASIQKTLMSAILGDGNAGGYRDYWQEYKRYGVLQDYTWGKESKPLEEIDGSTITAKTRKYLESGDAKNLRIALNQMGRLGSRALGALDAYNDYFNNVAPFAEYVTLRQAGLGAKAASRAVLDSLDFQQQGQLTTKMRIIYPFVKPIMQSSQAVARALGMSYDQRGFFKSSQRGIIVATAMGLALGSMVNAIKDQLGRDDDGNYRVDQLSISKISRGIPLGIGGQHGEYVMLPTGYGLPRAINAFVWGADRLARGLIDGRRFAGETLSIFYQEMAPGNVPEFTFNDNPAAFIAHYITPSYLLPLAEVATNRDTFGNQIYFENNDRTKAHADSGGGSSLKVYNEWAQGVRRWTGMDYYPEQVQHFIQGVLVGPLAVLRNVWENDDPSIRSTQHYKDTHLDPGLEFLGATMNFGYADDVARALFDTAEKKLIPIIRDNKIKRSEEGAYKKSDKAAKEAWWRQQMTEKNLPKTLQDDIVTYFKAADALKAGRPEINKWLRGDVASGMDYDHLQQAYNERTASRRDVVREAVNNMHMLRGAR